MFLTFRERLLWGNETDGDLSEQLLYRNRRGWAIYVMRLCGMTYRQIGYVVDLSTERARQLHNGFKGYTGHYFWFDAEILPNFAKHKEARDALMEFQRAFDELRKCECANQFADVFEDAFASAEQQIELIKLGNKQQAKAALAILEEIDFGTPSPEAVKYFQKIGG